MTHHDHHQHHASSEANPVDSGPVEDVAVDAGVERLAFSRRQFVTGAAKAGTVVGIGAAVWTAPQIRSVALAQEAVGTPPPDDDAPVDPVGEIDDDPPDPTDPTAPPVPDGEGAVPPERAAVPVAEAPPDVDASGRPLAGAAGDDASGRLAITGSDPRALAAGGGLIAATGGALLAIRNRLGRSTVTPESPTST